MNYRHAYHAGNFADCAKHALLHALAASFRRKPAPFRALDAFAGIGVYDLRAGEAARTGEAARGVGRLAGVAGGPLAPWLAEARAAGLPPLYPGSPEILRRALRADDRLALCELHPEDAAALRAAYRADPRVAVHRRDGWEAALALAPFPERRGLLLLDPPYEAEGDLDRLLSTVVAVSRRFRPCVQAAWYPIKSRAAPRAFRDGLAASGVRDAVACEIHLRAPTDPARLNGCGLAVVNPPWGFEDAARAILGALLAHLSDGEAGAGWEVARLADE